MLSWAYFDTADKTVKVKSKMSISISFGIELSRTSRENPPLNLFRRDQHSDEIRNCLPRFRNRTFFNFREIPQIQSLFEYTVTAGNTLSKPVNDSHFQPSSTFEYRILWNMVRKCPVQFRYPTSDTSR